MGEGRGLPLNMHDNPHEMLMMNNQPHHEGWKWVTAGEGGASSLRPTREWRPQTRVCCAAVSGPRLAAGWRAGWLHAPRSRHTS